MRLRGIILVLLLAACGDQEAANEARLAPRPFSTVIAETSKDTLRGAADIAVEPFEDIGMKRAPIPPRLAALVDDPYRMPVEPICLHIKEELIALNTVLGTPKVDKDVYKKAYRDESASLIEKQTLGILRGQVQLIPMRGVVRRVSGADRHARKVIRAYEAGNIRRAFLKGLAIASHCKNIP